MVGSSGVNDGPRGERSWRAGAAGLVALCLVVYLPGFFSLTPVDRDESRFAQASRQMFESVALPPGSRDPALHSGGLLIPKVQARDRLNKPPLIYWLQSGSAAVFSLGRPGADAIWMYRVPSLLAAIAAVLLTWRLGSSMFDERTGRLAAVLIACCPVVAWESRQARADMVLLALTTAAMLALWRVLVGRRSGETSGEPPEPAGVGWAFAFWIALALAIMTKGPIAPIVAGLTVLAFCVVSRRWRWVLGLRPLPGVVIVGAIVVPWVVLVAERVGWPAYLRTVTDETLGRVAASREGHWGPPGYHALLLTALFWPGSLMTAAGLGLTLRHGLDRGADRGGGRLARLFRVRAGHEPYLFGACWIIPAWVVFELIPTKLPHYTLPMYPAIAVLSARAVLAAEAGLIESARPRLRRAGVVAWATFGLVLAAGLPAGIGIVGGASGAWSWTTLVASALLCAAGAWQVIRAAAPGARALRAQFRGVVAFAMIFVGAVGLQLPAAPGFRLSARVVEAIRSADPEGLRPVAAVGYHEDSLVFLMRGRVDRIDKAHVGEWTRANPKHLLVIPERDVLRSHAVVARVAGFNSSRGRWERLAVVHHFLDGAGPGP